MRNKYTLYLLAIAIFLLIISILQTTFLTVKINDISETLDQWELQ